MNKSMVIRSNFGHTLYLEYINGMGEATFSEKVVSQWQRRMSVNAKLFAALKTGSPIRFTTMTGVGPETMIWQAVEE